jgi:hypothetical protein
MNEKINSGFKERVLELGLGLILISARSIYE